MTLEDGDVRLLLEPREPICPSDHRAAEQQQTGEASLAVQRHVARQHRPLREATEDERRIRDADGTEGWVNQALLSGERTAVAAPWMRGKGKEVYVNMRREAQSGASVVARLEPGVVFRIGECNGDWCRAEAGQASGWVSQGEISGAYPGEAFK